jgi:hypothetical protein
MTEGITAMGKGMVEDMLEALKDRQSELEIRLPSLTLSLPGTHLSVQLSGTLVVSVHMRELTDEEKEAYASANVAHLKG